MTLRLSCSSWHRTVLCQTGIWGCHNISCCNWNNSIIQTYRSIESVKCTAKPSGTPHVKWHQHQLWVMLLFRSSLGSFTHSEQLYSLQHAVHTYVLKVGCTASCKVDERAYHAGHSWFHTLQNEVQDNRDDSPVRFRRNRIEQGTCVKVNQWCAIYRWNYLGDDRAVVKSGLQCTIWVLHSMDLHYHIAQWANMCSKDSMRKQKVQATSREGKHPSSWQSALYQILLQLASTAAAQLWVWSTSKITTCSLMVNKTPQTHPMNTTDAI